jgi:hypothetical protein
MPSQSLFRVTLDPHHLSFERTRHGMDSQSLRSFTPFKTLEIVQTDTDAGYFLLCLSESGPSADSWHHSLEDAKHQAESNFGVTPEEWKASEK